MMPSTVARTLASSSARTLTSLPCLRYRIMWCARAGVAYVCKEFWHDLHTYATRACAPPRTMDIRHPIDTRLPALLRSGQRLRGVFNGLPSPAIVEMCGYA